MDQIDASILRELQTGGRLTNQELAERIGLSPSPCLRRVRALETAGVIRGYRARLDAASIGAGFEAFVSAELIRQDEQSIVAFEQAVLAIPAVVEARRMIGNPDYLMRVVAADLADYERLYTEVLARLPGVHRIGTQIAMRVLKDDAPLPVRLTG